MRRFNVTLWAATAVALAALTACKPSSPSPAGAASAAALDSNIEQTLRSNLKQALPDLPTIKAVRAMPMQNLYEILLEGNEIVYTDAQGQYLISGVLLDLKNKVDLTDKRTQETNILPFDQLQLQNSIVTKRGDGSRQLAVFADPNCKFCHRWETTLAKLDNVTIYTFLLPILSEDSKQKATHIWCAADRSAAWGNWMLKQVLPTAAECDTSALASNVEFARTHNIMGTPHTILANGQRIAGAIDLPILEKALQSSAQHSK